MYTFVYTYPSIYYKKANKNSNHSIKFYDIVCETDAKHAIILYLQFLYFVKFFPPLYYLGSSVRLLVYP